VQAAAGGILDEAAPAPQVQEVEPADRRRDDKDRPLEYGVRGRGVLQDLGDGVPGDDGAGVTARSRPTSKAPGSIIDGIPPL
jgi:hypothetical protein